MASQVKYQKLLPGALNNGCWFWDGVVMVRTRELNLEGFKKAKRKTSTITTLQGVSIVT